MTINNITKREQDALNRYYQSTEYDIYSSYKSPSSAKVRAWFYCIDLMLRHDGYGLKVIGHNSSFFSAGFLFENNGKECFMFITHGADTAVYIQ